MNYRQWKKNFKKQHGRNPGLFTDKIKDRKCKEAMLRNMAFLE